MTIENKLNELFDTELFKENNFIKIYNLLNIVQSPPVPTPPTVVSTLVPTLVPTPTTVVSTPPTVVPTLVPTPTTVVSTPPTVVPTPPTVVPTLVPTPTTVVSTPPTVVSTEQTINDVKVIYVRVDFKNDKKTFIINDKHKILNINLEEVFKDLEKDDLYKKKDKYVKYHTFNDNIYIICIEPDFTENNDDTSLLVNDLFNILTDIYKSIIAIFKNIKNINKKLILSVPSIIDDKVSIINKKTILGCFSKIYKEKYKMYEIDIGNDELREYFNKLIK